MPADAVKNAIDLMPTVQGDQSPMPRPLVPGAVSLKIEASTLADPEGAVRGAFLIEAHKGDAPADAYLIQDGDVVAAPAGSAVLVQSPAGWERCDFAEEGRLIGPLVYSAVAGRSNAELLHIAGKGRREVTTILTMLTGGISLVWPMAALGNMLMGEMGGVIGMLIWLVGLATVIFFKADAAERKVFSLCEKMTALNPKFGILSRQKENLSVTLSDRVRHLAGYSPVAIEARMPHHETDEIDEEIHEAETSYRARRRELYSQAGSVPQYKALDYVSGQLSAFSQRIQESPRLLRSREIRSAYLGLLRRAEENVAIVIERRAAAEQGDLLADLSALSQQMDTYKP